MMLMSKKFDVVIGNPPYQETNEKSNRDEAIYHLFYDVAKDIAVKYCLITPARFLFNAGATPKNWNRAMLSDEHLKVIFYNQNSSKVFRGTDIKGGVAILYRDDAVKFGSIDTFTISKDLDSILNKVVDIDFTPISDELYGNSSYKLTDIVYIDYPELSDRVSVAERRALGSNAFSRFPELFTEQEGVGCVLIYGRIDNERKYMYVSSKYIEDGGNLNGFKVFIPGANGTGDFGETLSSPTVGLPGIGHTQTFISIGNFQTEFEAESLLKYLKGRFSRAMLGVKKVTQNNKTKETWSKIPLQDFTEDSDIDWSVSIPEIDQQLYMKYGLNEEEINFIETNVKEMT